MCIPRKINFLQLGRYGRRGEQCYRQTFRKDFYWLGFNMNLAADRFQYRMMRLAIAIDPSYVSKSGKKTDHIGRFWSGCASAVKRGLEILGFAHIVPGVSDARFLFVVQTLPGITKGRTPFYLVHMKDDRDKQTARCLGAIHEQREQLLAISGILVGDCLFASLNFVTGAVALGFDVVSRLRDDAVLQYLYTGTQKPGRGRPKELDGTVDINNLREGGFARESVRVDGDDFTLFSATVKCKSLKRRIKVVIFEFKCGARAMRKILFSTDTSMATARIFLTYYSIFQIEFLFRCAKQNTGLEDWQSREADSLSFGYNASLTAVNVAWEMADDIEKATGRRLSVTSVKKVIHNATQYQHIKEFIERLKSEDPQINFTLSDEIPDKLLFFGVRDSA